MGCDVLDLFKFSYYSVGVYRNVSHWQSNGNFFAHNIYWKKGPGHWGPDLYGETGGVAILGVWNLCVLISTIPLSILKLH